MDWEIRESLRLGKQVIGVYPGDAAPRLPKAFGELGLRAIRWQHEALMREIEGEG